MRFDNVVKTTSSPTTRRDAGLHPAQVFHVKHPGSGVVGAVCRVRAAKDAHNAVIKVHSLQAISGMTRGRYTLTRPSRTPSLLLTDTCPLAARRSSKPAPAQVIAKSGL